MGTDLFRLVMNPQQTGICWGFGAHDSPQQGGRRNAGGGGLDITAILQSRLVVKPADFDRSVAFYERGLGLQRAREWGRAPVCGVVYFTGGGYLELVGGSSGEPVSGATLWLQVPRLDDVFTRLASIGVAPCDGPGPKPWGLLQMTVIDPDGLRILVVEVPADHPMRRDARTPEELLPNPTRSAE